MKKTILAVVTSTLLAASAQAATVYDKDGSVIDVTGRFEYDAGQLGFKTDADGNDISGGKVNNFGGETTARLGVAGKFATAYDVALISKLEWQLKSEQGTADNQSDVTARYAFAGADFGNGVQATVGQQDSAYVELSDVTDVFNYYSGLDENLFASRWADSYKVTYVADGWDLRASVAFSDAAKDPSWTPSTTYSLNPSTGSIDSSTSETYAKNNYSAAAGYTFKIDDLQSLKVVAAYQASTEYVSPSDTTDHSYSYQYAGGFGYTYDALYLATTWGQYQGFDADYKYDVWTTTASYKVLPELTLFANYSIVDPHNAVSKGDTDGSANGANGAYYVFGTQYDLTAKAKVYAEYKLNQTAGYENQYAVGMQYNF